MKAFRLFLAAAAVLFLSVPVEAEVLSADDIWTSAKNRAKEKVAEGDMEGARRILAEAKELIKELAEGDARVASSAKAPPASMAVFVLEDGTMFLDGEDRPLDADALREAVRKSWKKHGADLSVRIFADATARHGDVRRVFDVCAEEGWASTSMDRRGARGRLVRKEGEFGKKPRYAWSTDPEPLAKVVYESWTHPAAEAAVAFGLDRIDPEKFGEVEWFSVLRPSPGDGVVEPTGPVRSSVRSPIVLRRDASAKMPTVSIDKPRSESPYFFVFNGIRCSEVMLSGYFRQIARANRESLIVFDLTNESPNGLLLRALELAKEQGLDRFAIFSLDEPAPRPAQLEYSPSGIMASRAAHTNGTALAKYGAGGEAAVMRALRWLKSVQNEDGSWDGCRPAMTGLAILAFLAHNELPAGPEEEFGPTVEKAIRWLVDNQGAGGFFRGRDGNGYAQSIATYALCEAYSMTRNPLVKEAAERALVPIIEGQHPSGGWDYNFRQSEREDTSFMGWAAQAVAAGRAAGLRVPGLEECYRKISRGMLINYDQGYGGFGYTGPAHSGLSGIGALCMQLAGDGDRPEVKKTMRMLSTAKFGWDKYDGPQPYTLSNGQSPLYFWYYMTRAFFLEGDSAFSGWNKQFLPELIRRQVVEKAAIADLKGKMRDVGYWDSPSAGENHVDGGVSFPCIRFKNGAEEAGTTTMGRRVQDTCLCALQLMVYYRFLPASQPQDKENPPPDAPAAVELRGGAGDVKVGARRRE